MTHPQTDANRAADSAIQCSASPESHCTLCGALWEHVSLRFSGGARRLKILVRHDCETVVLAGIVNSFYAKQLLYQICRHRAPGLRLIDTTAVGHISDSHAQRRERQSRFSA